MPVKKQKDIQEYNRKRHFDVTEEPKGEVKKRKAKLPVFVIQKHDASRLHYDLRLEVEGVMASWAVPKGPSMVKGERHLAVHVEDHPINYNTFEGNIPEGEYGGGSVIVWDRGTYENIRESDEKPKAKHKTMRQSIEDGKVEFLLHGEKLRGAFVLIRTDKDKDQWILMKMDDEEALEDGDIREERPESVISGKTVEEVAELGDGRTKESQRAQSAAS
jgi:DNA ligase D-like protein (predicted 3'-phosphoesterase)